MKRAAYLTFMMALMIAALACRGEPEEWLTPMPEPATLTDSARTYAECAIGKAYGGYGGNNWRGLFHPQLQQARCRLLLPGDIAVHTMEEFQLCLEQQTQWAIREYGVGEWPDGFRSLQVMAYAEAVCAPSPSANSQGG